MTKYNPIISLLISLLCGIFSAILFAVLIVLGFYALETLISPFALKPPLYLDPNEIRNLLMLPIILLGSPTTAITIGYYAKCRYRRKCGLEEKCPSFRNLIKTSISILAGISIGILLISSEFIQLFFDGNEWFTLATGIKNSMTKMASSISNTFSNIYILDLGASVILVIARLPVTFGLAIIAAALSLFLRLKPFIYALITLASLHLLYLSTFDNLVLKLELKASIIAYIFFFSTFCFIRYITKKVSRKNKHVTVS